MTRRHAVFALALALSVALAGCSSPDDDADGTTDGDGSDDVPPPTPPQPTQPPPASPPAMPPSPPGPPPPAPPPDDGAPLAPVTVSLQVANATDFFGPGTRVTLTVRGVAADRITAGIVVPDGVALVSGQTRYDGPLREETPVEVVALLNASAEGEYLLRGWAERPTSPGSRIAPSDVVGVRGSSDGAETFAPLPQPPEFGVAAVPDPADTSAFNATVTGPATAGVRIELLPPSAFSLAEGEPTWEGEMPFEGRVVLDWRVGFPAQWDPGYYVVGVYVYPDPAVDGRLYHDELYYAWDGYRVVVTDRPPDQG